MNIPATEKIITDWGYVVEIGGTDELGVSLLAISSGARLPAHYHKVMLEYEIVIKGSPKVNGKTRPEGSVNVWKQGQVHEYVNASREEVKILCITLPPYDPGDEIRIETQ